MRNERLKHAKLRPLPEKHFLQGGSRLGAASVTEPVSVPPSAALDSPAAIGRQLLSRRIAYANFDSLPDPSRFQLHHDLKGWRGCPSRLDFLYKELVRQRNAAVRWCSFCWNQRVVLRSMGGGSEIFLFACRQNACCARREIERDDA